MYLHNTNSIGLYCMADFYNNLIRDSILDMSTKDFLVDNIRFLHDWIYSWFWNDFLDFVYQFPALIVSSLKAIINYYLGYWLLGKLK